MLRSQELHMERIVETMFSLYPYKHVSPYQHDVLVQTLYT